jgi:hypothetical protein
MERPMALWKSEHSPRYELTIHAPEHHLDLLVLVAAVATLGLLLIWLVPLPLILPVLGSASFLGAGFAALFAYCSGSDRHATGMTAWDVAGAFALIWVAAGMLSEPARVVELLDHIMIAD